MKLDHALDLASQTGNGCDESTHRFWYHAITEEVPYIQGGAVIEVGCAKGGGTTTLAAACQERGFGLHCCDSWYTDTVPDQREGPLRHKNWETVSRGYPHFIVHVDQLRKAGLNQLVLRHVGDSTRIGMALDVPCIFLWIDGGHHWPTPYNDFLAFSRLVVPGGIVGFHDVGFVGVRRSLETLEAGGCLQDWRELQDIPKPSWILPEGEKRISSPVGFATRAWERAV